MKKILIHGCCADCTLKLWETIKDEAEIYFYNPNIHPRSEYLSRLKAMQQICQENEVKLIVADWKPRDYFKIIKEGKRCHKCWQLRIEECGKYALEHGFETFSTTLLSSKYQNRDEIEKIGNRVAKKYGIHFLVPEKIITELKTKGFYKQFFCGCVYSLKERFEEKYL